MKMLITNIKGLLVAYPEAPEKVNGNAMADLPVVDNAWLLTEGEEIRSFGPMEELPEVEGGYEEIDATGRFVLPAWCDSHTHLVYAGSRELEYINKIRGLSYEEIAKRGGGIQNSAKLLRNTPEDELYQQSMVRVREIISQGTGAVEIKSGYGLTTEDELKMLRVIRRIGENTPLTVKATFLGAHAVPEKYKGKREAYVDLVVKEMIPAVAREGLADYIDVFCDRGFFSVRDTERILEAGTEHGMVPKIHANELDYSGGVQTGTRYGALSTDHLEFTGDDEIRALRASETMPTVLPGASLFLGMSYAPARNMIGAGLPLALATDYNPGSSPSGNMKLIMSLGCIQLRMLPEEVLHAVTLNGAYAMGVSGHLGTITPGKTANLLITKEIPTYAFLPYAYGSNLVETVILNGRVVEE